MTKQKKRLLILLLALAVIVVYCWGTILRTGILPAWRHYLGLILFVGLAFLFFKNSRTTVIAAGIYLLLASFNLVAITADQSISWINIGRISTPPVQLTSLALLILYFVLNLDTLINIYLDYKEAQEAKLKG